MRNDATGTPSGGNKRKKIVFAALGVLVLAGVGIALFLPDREPALSIPDRVCAEAVPSTHVKSLLPERGRPFEEERAVNFMRDASKGLGMCDLSGGGRIFEIRYSRLQDPKYSREWVQRDASKPGNIPLSLGAAGGYIESYNRAELFVDCPYAKGRKDLLEVSVGIGGVSETKDSTRQAELSALAADVARVVARDVERCEGAADLPDGAPKVG
ncbi:hypothetical protein ACFU8Q_04890 [Streptomyces sp. NPDC057543]|uniref:hypothetical protein n=1 Tax=Streptomyces sp. NPDC057543 TaxID=3346163 RepID=UPI0036D1F50E